MYITQVAALYYRDVRANISVDGAPGIVITPRSSKKFIVTTREQSPVKARALRYAYGVQFYRLVQHRSFFV